MILLLSFPNLLFGQSQNLSLLTKYVKSEWLSQIFFDNFSNYKLVTIKSVEKLLDSNVNSEIKLELKYQSSNFFKSKSITFFDTSGILKYREVKKFKFSPRRINYFLASIPSKIKKLVIKSDTAHIDCIQAIHKNENGLIVQMNTKFWQESYSYDRRNNLVKIDKVKKHIDRFSDELNLVCGSSAKKWIGEYDLENLLIKETTFWDNGNEFNAIYFFENGLLVKSECLNLFRMSEVRKFYYLADYGYFFAWGTQSNSLSGDEVHILSVR